MQTNQSIPFQGDFIAFSFFPFTLEEEIGEDLFYDEISTNKFFTQIVEHSDNITHVGSLTWTDYLYQKCRDIPDFIEKYINSQIENEFSAAFDKSFKRIPLNAKIKTSILENMAADGINTIEDMNQYIEENRENIVFSDTATKQSKNS